MRRAAALLNALCALVSLGVVAVTAGVMLLDPNDYKERLVAAVQDATGRTLTIGGELRLTRSLLPTLEATDIALSNLVGGSRADMAHAERIEGQLSLLALLRREIEITRLTLIGPNILFEQVGGRPNWVFDRAAPSPAPAAAAAKPSPPFELRIRAAHVRNGMVTWKLPARTKVVGIRSLDFRRPRENGPVEAQSTLVYGDNKPFALDVRADPTGGVMEPWRTRLHFAAFDTDATATGTMDVAGHYDLRVEGVAGALEKLNALLPEMGLPALRQMKVSAQIGNGSRPGDIPVLGASTVQFASGDLRDRVPGLVLGATRATLAAAGGQASVDGAGQYAGTGFHVTGGVGVPVRPDGKASVPVALKVEGADAALTLKGAVALDTLRFAGLDAAATLEVAALAGLRPVLGAGVPALTGVRFSGQVAVPAGGGTVRLRGATLRTEQGDVAGDGSVDVGAVPGVTGTWRSGVLDVDAVLVAFGLSGAFGPSGAAQATTGPMIPNTALPWAGLRGATLDLDGAVGEMRFQGQVWRDVAGAVSLKGGLLQAGPVSVGGAGGRMHVGLTANAGAVSLSVAAPGLPLAVLGRLVGMPGPIAGSAAVNAQLRARGQTVRELASTVEGPFSVAAVGGRFSNAGLIELMSAALDALGITVPAQGETALGCLGLAGSFAGGVGTFKTIALETTYLSLEGVGQVDLGRETVAFKLQPMAVVAGSPVSVPVVVQGPFRNVSGGLDAGGLQQLGFLLDGLFGGDTSKACAAAGLK